MNRTLLDTDAYTSYLAGDGGVTEAMSRAEVALLSVIVLGDLHAGFRGGTRQPENLELLDQFLAIPAVHVQPVTRETSVVCGGWRPRPSGWVQSWSATMPTSRACWACGCGRRERLLLSAWHV